MTSSEPEKPAAQELNGGYGWIVVLAVFSINVVCIGWLSSLGIVIDELLETSTTSPSLALSIVSVYTSLLSLIAPMAHILSTRFSIRVTMTIGSFIHAAGIILSALKPHSPEYLIGTLGITAGVGIAFVHPPSFVIVVQYFSRRRGLAVGLAGCGCTLGVIPPLVRYLIDQYTLRGCFLIYGGIALNAIWLSMLCRPVEVTLAFLEQTSDRTNGKQRNHDFISASLIDSESRYSVESQKAGSAENNSAFPSPKKPFETEIIPKGKQRTCIEKEVEVLLSLRTLAEPDNVELTGIRKLKNLFGLDLLSDYRCTLFIISCATVTVAYISVVGMAPRMLVENNYSQDKAALAMTILGIGSIAGRCTFGLVSDLNLCDRRVGYASMLLVGCIAISGFLYSYSFGSIAFSVFLQGFSIGSLYSIELVCLVEVVGIHRATAAMGVLYFIKGVINFPGVFLVGVIRDYFGSWEASVIYVTCVAGAGALNCFISLAIEGVLFRKCNWNCKSS